MTVKDPSFDIPYHPERVYPPQGGVEYVGETTFYVTPDPPDDDLSTLVTTVLDADPYTYGDWFDLPLPVYLVHDRQTRDVFRVVIRNGNVEFHVLPDTESAGLRALYDRLVAASDADWHVECRTSDGP